MSELHLDRKLNLRKAHHTVAPIATLYSLLKRNVKIAPLHVPLRTHTYAHANTHARTYIYARESKHTHTRTHTLEQVYKY